MLYLIGLGLEIGDINLKTLDSIKKCKKVYLESYTSTGASIKELKKLLKKELVIAHRELIEDKAFETLKEAKKENIAILVYGDPLIATTHINYVIEAKKLKIKVKIIHNVSVLNVISETGLMPYNFGKITSIPFSHGNIKTPLEVIKNNLKLGLHSLILLDLDPKNNKFLTINQALFYLDKNGVKGNVIACASLGTSKQKIKYDKIEEILKLKFNSFPQCLIIPGKMHFREEEALELWK